MSSILKMNFNHSIYYRNFKYLFILGHDEFIHILSFLSLIDLSIIDVSITNKKFRNYFLNCLHADTLVFILPDDIQVQLQQHYQPQIIRQSTCMKWIAKREIRLRNIFIPFQCFELLTSSSLSTVTEFKATAIDVQELAESWNNRNVEEFISLFNHKLQSIELSGSNASKLFLDHIIDAYSNLLYLELTYPGILPQKLLKAIFCSTKSLVLRCIDKVHNGSGTPQNRQPLMRNFKKLICPNLIYLRIEVNSTFTDEHLWDITLGCINLSELYLTSCSLLTTEGLVDISINCRYLTKLCLQDLEIDIEDSLNAFLLNCPQLIHIQLLRCLKLNIKSQETIFIRAMNKNAFYLRHLEIWSNHCMSDAAIASIFHGCISLISLKIYIYPSIGTARAKLDMNASLFWRIEAIHLEILECRGPSISPATIVKIASKCTKLHTLKYEENLWDVNFRRRAGGYLYLGDDLFCILESCVYLTTILFDSLDLSSAFDIQYLIHMKPTNITSISFLGRNNIHPTCLANFLLICPKLKFLKVDLENMLQENIDTHEMYILRDSLQKCTELKELTIINMSGYSFEIVELLLLSCCSQKLYLLHLGIQGLNISDKHCIETTRQLRREFPYVRIELSVCSDKRIRRK